MPSDPWLKMQQEESRPKRARLAAGRRSLELFRSRARLTALVELEESALGEDGTVGGRAPVACQHPGMGVSGCCRFSCAPCGHEGESGQRGGKKELSLPRMLAPIEDADGVCGDAFASGGRRGVLEGSSDSVLSPSVRRCEMLMLLLRYGSEKGRAYLRH